jgi:hypothetical protein
MHGVSIAINPASWSASGRVGWAWIVSAKQSIVNSLATASVISAIKDDAS